MSFPTRLGPTVRRVRVLSGRLRVGGRYGEERRLGSFVTRSLPPDPRSERERRPYVRNRDPGYYVYEHRFQRGVGRKGCTSQGLRYTGDVTGSKR